jgi:regulator of protease activity HflC (stomatin/prohibitin superfamily)
MYQNYNSSESLSPQVVKLVIGGIGLFVALIIIIAMFPIASVGAGERGVIFNTTSGVEDRILGEGLHFRIPFFQSVRTVNVRVQKDETDALAGSNDLQTVTIRTVVNWRLDASKVNVIYQEIGDEEAVLNSIVRPRVAEIVKSETAKYSAEDMLTKRSELKAGIDARLREDLIKYNIILDDITLNDIDFSDQFNQAIELKATAEQNAIAEENKLRQVEAQAKQKVELAKAEAESIRIQSEALANNEGLIDLKWVERWNGQLPTYVGTTTPLMSIK